MWATHRFSSRLSRGRHALGQGRTLPDSLIVIMKGGHSWCLRGSRVSCCQVIYLERCISIRVSVTPSVMDDSCSLLSFCRSANSLCSYEIYGYVNDMTTW
jgi:hypothetical protein